MHTPASVPSGAAVLTTLGLVAVAAAATSAAPASAQSVPKVGIVCTSSPNSTFDLTTKTGNITLPDSNTMFMWGYSSGSSGFQHPSPVLCVDQGDTVTVILHNTFAEPVSVMFPGQENVLANGAPAQPQFDAGGNLTSLTNTAAGPVARSPTASSRTTRARICTSRARIPTSRCAWVCSAR